jgi:hypothetical protein
MSVNLANLYAQQFATNFQLLLQQKGSRFRGKMMEQTHYGEQASPVDQIGVIEMQEVTTRFEPITRTDAPVDRRWVAPSAYDLSQLVDSFDELKMLTDPKSKYVENATKAAGRQLDRLVVTAFTGTALTGKTGSTSTVFNTAYSVASNFGASSAIGMSVAKLREAKRLLMANEVDLENDPIYVGVTAKQHDDLLGEVQVTSQDFNDKPVLVEGKIARFMGFEFVHTELLGTSSSERVCPFWAKSGMHIGIWADLKTDVDRRKDLKGLPWQAYVYMQMGATRIEEKKVGRILCSES